MGFLNPNEYNLVSGQCRSHQHMRTMAMLVPALLYVMHNAQHIWAVTKKQY